MMWTSIRHTLVGALLLVLVLGATISLAQTGTTSLRGTVTDKSGAAIVGAKITINNPEQSLERTALSGGTGQFEFLALPPGTFALTIEKDNFQRYVQSNLQLLVNSPATQDVTLQVGSPTQTVEVTIGVQTLNTTDASLGNAFSERQVKELP